MRTEKKRLNVTFGQSLEKLILDKKKIDKKQKIIVKPIDHSLHSVKILLPGTKMMRLNDKTYICSNQLLCVCVRACARHDMVV